MEQILNTADLSGIFYEIYGGRKGYFISLLFVRSQRYVLFLKACCRGTYGEVSGAQNHLHRLFVCIGRRRSFCTVGRTAEKALAALEIFGEKAWLLRELTNATVIRKS